MATVSFPSLALVTLLLCLCGAELQASVRVLIDAPAMPFFVNVSTHHADLHNGHSKSRYKGILQSNETHRVPVGFYLSTTHFSAWAYHPDYVLTSVLSEGRLSPLPKLEPVTWADAIKPLDSLPVTGSGPTYARAVEHIELYNNYYLPALDQAKLAPEPGAAAEMVSFFSQMEAFAGLEDQTMEEISATAARLRQKALVALQDMQLLLSLSSSQRVAMRNFQELTAGPVPMIKALQREAGFAQVPQYLQGVTRYDREAQGPTWQGEHVDARMSYMRGDFYRLRSKEHDDPLPCYKGYVQFDGRYLVGDAYPDLLASVETSFCQHPDGKWQLSSRWAD